MAKRKAAAETTDRRTNVNIPLTPQANRIINEWCDRTGGSKAQLIQRVLEWFGGAPESMQRVITRDVPRDMAKQYVDRAGEWFREQVEAVNRREIVGTEPILPPASSSAAPRKRVG